MSSVPGYFAAMKAVCERHGALLIYDEVMCGIGRTGTLHAWEHDGVAPDIQAIGKTLGSGYVPISAVLVNEKVISVFNKGNKFFAHGQTYQSHPLACAAALEVQRIMKEDKLVENVRAMGVYLEKLLRERLGNHPHVGDIRGRGLFWAIEFVAERETKATFDPELKIANRMHEKGMKKGYSISLFQATGSGDSGLDGDHILLAPPYIVQNSDVEEIVDRVGRVVEEVFLEIEQPKTNGILMTNGKSKIDNSECVGVA
jgi:adenosylmethionine-8-amino-7-oxononanoate aminotransferase